MAVADNGLLPIAATLKEKFRLFGEEGIQFLHLHKLR